MKITAIFQYLTRNFGFTNVRSSNISKIVLHSHKFTINSFYQKFFMYNPILSLFAIRLIDFFSGIKLLNFLKNKLLLFFIINCLYDI